MTNPTVNYPLYCEDCTHRMWGPDMMVGSYSSGGGPEESIICKKGNNPEYYWFNSQSDDCPDCEHFDY